MSVLSTGYILSSPITATSLSTSSKCKDFSSTTSLGKTVKKNCVLTASKKINKDGSCIEYKYDEVKVTATNGPFPLNNGIPKCSKKICDASTEPEKVDCKSVFDNKDMTEINKKRNS